MSNTTDAAYHLKSACVWRSSQDFFPNEPKTHGLHVFDNAFNSIWVRTFALPDWDMFQSGHSAGAFHAAARAISGGPVYVSDKPESHDFSLLSKLMLRDGRILRSKQPAVPSRDSLFEDGRTLPRVTKIVNFNEVAGRALPIGVLGIFNCYYNETGIGQVKGSYCAADVPGISAPRFALYHQTTGQVKLAERGERFPISLETLGYELVTVSPMEQGVALFGLLDKFNGSRALESACWISANELELELVDGGRVGWSSGRGTPLVSFKGAPVEVFTQGDLAWVQLPENQSVTLLLNFE
jgi:raffinose synthase